MIISTVTGNCSFLSLPTSTKTTTLTLPPTRHRRQVVLCSSSSVIAQQEEKSEDTFTLSSSTRGCEGCGREEVEKGCNGEGRIQGGIATVPGFGWWPIKAYRPCPGFVASGGRYRRRGQSMDEVASGEGKKPKKAPPMVTNDEPQPSKNKKKKQGPKKFKR